MSILSCSISAFLQVNVETVIANFKKSAETVKNTLIEAIKLLKTEEWDDVIAANRVGLALRHFTLKWFVLMLGGEVI